MAYGSLKTTVEILDSSRIGGALMRVKSYLLRSMVSSVGQGTFGSRQEQTNNPYLEMSFLSLRAKLIPR